MYYDYDAGVCVSAQDCRETHNKYVFKGTIACTGEYSVDESDEHRPVPEGYVFTCKKKPYLVLSNGKATCADAGACAELYLYKTKRICIGDAHFCANYLQGLAYDIDGKRLCVSTSECIESGNYYHGDFCRTPRQCISNNAYAYKKTGYCLKNAPDTVNGGFNGVLSGNYEYACSGNTYIDMTSSATRCIDEGECKGVLHETLRICINYQDHTVYPYWCYIYRDGAVMKCRQPSHCVRLQRYPYPLIFECSDVPADMK